MSESKKKIQILIDDPTENPGKEFDKISQAIYDLIINSTPKFTVGITGEWGTGKTTMMNAIRSKFESKELSDISYNDLGYVQYFTNLKNKLINYEKSDTSKQEGHHNIKNETHPTAWFNAWRYEHENTKATIPLLITIIERLLYWIHQNETSDSDKSILSKLRSDIVNFLNSCDYHLQIAIPGISFDVNKDGNNQEERNVSQFADGQVLGIRKPVIQKGLDIIEQMMSMLRKDNKFRLVIFIDDLDRCTPSKALEVFESIKILLDITGIVYVLGISEDTIAKLIDHEYKNMIKGDEYIKKIVQIKYPLRSWRTNDIKEIIINNIVPELGDNAPNFLTNERKEENYALINDAIQANPRELKRFLNSLILSFEVVKKVGMSEEVLLIIEALRTRWGEFFEELTREGSTIKKTIEDFIDLEQSQIKSQIEEIRQKQPDKETLPNDYKHILDLPEQLWVFLNKYYKTISQIEKEDWMLYLQATESIRQMDGDEDYFNQEMYELLIEGKIQEFNKKRPGILTLTRAKLSNVDLTGADLSGARLSTANLSGAILVNTKLTDANLIDVDFSNVDLSNSNLTNANLTGAKFTESVLTNVNFATAYLTNAKLIRSDLTNAKILGANLINAEFVESSLINTDLSGSNLISAKFTDTILTNTNFFHVRFFDAKTNNSEFEQKPQTKEILLIDENQYQKDSEEYNKQLKQILENLDVEFRDVVLDDNPKYKEFWNS